MKLEPPPLERLRLQPKKRTAQQQFFFQLTLDGCGLTQCLVSLPSLTSMEAALVNLEQEIVGKMLSSTLLPYGTWLLVARGSEPSAFGEASIRIQEAKTYQNFNRFLCYQFGRKFILVRICVQQIFTSMI